MDRQHLGVDAFDDALSPEYRPFGAASSKPTLCTRVPQCKLSLHMSCEQNERLTKKSSGKKLNFDRDTSTNLANNRRLWCYELGWIPLKLMWESQKDVFHYVMSMINEEDVTLIRQALTDIPKIQCPSSNQPTQCHEARRGKCRMGGTGFRTGTMTVAYACAAYAYVNVNVLYNKFMAALHRRLHEFHKTSIQPSILTIFHIQIQ